MVPKSNTVFKQIKNVNASLTVVIVYYYIKCFKYLVYCNSSSNLGNENGLSLKYLFILYIQTHRNVIYL